MTIRNPRSPIPNSSLPSRISLWKVIKWSLFAIVMVFVVRQAHELWNQEEIRGTPLEQIQIRWVLLSSVAYIAGWLPSVWFWQRIMLSFGGDVRFRDSARAYYCGHLGKYVPGKAMVLIIRSTMMKDRGTRGWAAALGATYETLVMMGTGLAVGLALAPLLFEESQYQNWPGWLTWSLSQPIVPAVTMVIACLAILPVLSRLLSAIAARWTPADVRAEGKTVGVSTQLLAEGMGAFVLAWLLQGLSLGFSLKAVGAAEFGSSFLTDWLVWTGATALSTSLGFAVLFAPGGLGVREGIMIAVLNHQMSINPRQAILATVLSRLVSLVAEIIAAGVLYYGVKPANPVMPTSKGSP